MQTRIHLHFVATLGLLGTILVGCDSNEAPPPATSSKTTPSRKARPADAEADRGPENDPRTTATPRDVSDLTADNALSLRDDLRKNPTRWNSALGPFYRAWASLDPEAALQAAGNEGRTSVAAVTMALSGWASTDPEAAADWLTAQPDGPHRDRHAAGLIQGWPADRMSDLATRVTDLAQSSPSSTLPVRLTARWLHDDPTAAAEWLGGMTPADSTTRATDLLFQEWGTADPTAAGEFLVNNPEAPNGDVAAAAYAKAVVPDDAETAALWAEAIENPDLRSQIKDVIPLLNQPRDPQQPGRPILPGNP